MNWFSGSREVTPGAFLRGDRLFLDGQQLMQASDIPIRGRHNAENVLAAVASLPRAPAYPTRQSQPPCAHSAPWNTASNSSAI